MNLIERYIFRRIVNATVLTFIALGAMVWLSQALRQFDLVTANGQTISTFFEVSALLMPVLVAVVFPVALMIAVIFTFNSLNSDSELVVINASGARQITVLKPVLLVSFIATIIVASMSLYFSPLALSAWTSLITNVRGNIIMNFMHEGAFVQLSPNLTFHMQSRNTDGSLRGIFVADDRDPTKSSTYLAEKGALLDNPLGLFLIMSNGTIQQRSSKDGAISMIEFSSYAFDLSTFSARGAGPALRPMERPTTYLLNPDADDPYFRDAPGKFRAELTDRVTSPLYVFLFALIPLLFLGQAGSARQSRNASIGSAVLLTTCARIVPVFLPSQTSLIATIFMYVVPLGLTVGTVVLIALGIQLHPPDRVVAVIEGAYDRVTGLFTARSAATAQ
jgi:lipopolysaccharide export system permease protein